MSTDDLTVDKPRFDALTEAQIMIAEAEAEVIAAEAKKIAAEHTEREAAALERIAEVKRFIGDFKDELLSDIAVLYKAAAGKVAMGVIDGEILIRHGDDAAKLVKELSTAGRLEAGESTSRHEVLDRDQAVANVKALRDTAQKRLDEAAVADEVEKKMQAVVDGDMGVNVTSIREQLSG